MAIEDVFNGAKTAFSFYGAYLKTLTEEFGMERALALNTKMLESLGTMQGKKMKEEAGIKEFDAKAACSLLKTTPENVGMKLEVVEESPQRVVTRTGKCPIYEAGQMVGLDAKTMETICSRSSMRLMDAAAKELNPNLSYRLRKFRSGPDDFCEEEIVLG